MLGFVTIANFPAGLQGQGAAPGAARSEGGVHPRDFRSFIEGDAETAPDDPAVTPAPTTDSEASGAAEHAGPPDENNDLEVAADDQHPNSEDEVYTPSRDDLASLAAVGAEPDSFAPAHLSDVGSRAEDEIASATELTRGAVSALGRVDENLRLTGHHGAGAGVELPQAGGTKMWHGRLFQGGEPRTLHALQTQKPSIEAGATVTTESVDFSGGDSVLPTKAIVRANGLTDNDALSRVSGNDAEQRSARSERLETVPSVSADRSSAPEVRWTRPVVATEISLQGNPSGFDGLNVASSDAVDPSNPTRHGMEAALAADHLSPRGLADPRQGAVANAQPIARHVAVQIAEAAAKGADRAIDIILNPAELGRVRITVTHGETGLFVNVAAERSETLDLMRRNGEILGRSFEDMGQGAAEFTFSQDERRNGDLLPENERGAAAPLLLGSSSDPEMQAGGERIVTLDRLDIRL